MTATINWSVNKMDCYSQQDGNTDVVFVVCWVCRGTQEVNGEIYAAQINDNTTIPAPSGGSFTPYDQLTQDQVLGWVWANGVDKDAIETAVQAQVAAEINPVVVAPPLPWGVQPPTSGA